MYFKTDKKSLYLAQNLKANIYYFIIVDPNLNG